MFYGGALHVILTLIVIISRFPKRHLITGAERPDAENSGKPLLTLGTAAF